VRVLIAGAYGVFGQLLARELLETTDLQLIVAGRDGERVKQLFRELGASPRVMPLELDIEDVSAFARALQGCFAVACTAGPFQTMSLGLPWVAANAGVHWLDIGDPPRWVFGLLDDRALHEKAKETGAAVIPGLSTVPAVSSVLARCALKKSPLASRARITLFVGNRNAKSKAAIITVLDSGLWDPIRLQLGALKARSYRIKTPDAILFEREAGIAAEIRVTFESSATAPVIRAGHWLAQRLAPRGRERLATFLAKAAIPLSRFGTNRWWMTAEAISSNGVETVEQFSGTGQRIAVIPCAIALESLSNGEITTQGCVSPAELLPLDDWVQRLTARGVEHSG